MTAILVVVLLLSIGSASAAEIGRITGDVNFRKGPSRSTARIGRLPAGAEVEVIKRESNGWHLVVHRGQRGFVHPNYIAVKTAPQIRTRTGIILIVIGAMLVALHYFPALPRIATFLVFSFFGVFLLDAGFRFGVLYSLFLVSLGLLLVLVFLTRKEKKEDKPSEKTPHVYRKAA